MSSNVDSSASRSWQPKTGVSADGLPAPRFARVLLPEEEFKATPMAWRLVGRAAPAQASPAAAQSTPDITAQIHQIQQQCEQRIAEARAAGLREGEAAARTRAAAEVQPVLEKLARSIEDLAQVRVRLRKQAEGDTIKLSLAIAKRVLRRELAMDADAMRGLVTAALEKLQAQEICRVRANPSQAAAITACLRQTVSNAKVEVIPDGSLQPGGVIFETNQGNLDASVDSQLQEIEHGLADHLRKQS
jgi:flagellar assembly protein FliH